MKISVNWIKRYTRVDLSIDELVEKIGAQLGEVESVTNLGNKYKGVLIVKVVNCDNHPDADKLHVCTIDDGGVVSGLPRDVNSHVQVVCGANNVDTGQTVVWLPPGVTIPSTVGTDSPVDIEAKELRGVLSQGMIASARELALGDDHDGILVIDEDIKPGTPLVEAMDLDDCVIDIENKMFTHRPDCFGILGVAREIAGIQGQAFKSPEWYLKESNGQWAMGNGAELPLVVKNELPDLVPRFMAVVMSGVNVKPSSIKMQTYLTKHSIKPINNVVDVTNYFMLLTAQPMHAYDYDKVKALSNGDIAEIIVRSGQKGEKLTLLGGKTIEPTSGDIVIATGKQAIGLGGVMGGADTEVGDATKNIIIECANFDMYTIRKTSMTHGLFTDAVTRFSKGQSPLQNDKVLARAIEVMQDHTGGQIASKIIDDKHLKDVKSVSVSPKFINDRLGLNLDANQIGKTLQNVEFKVEIQGEGLNITPPFWRTDIEIPEDVVEEVGRLIGYDKLPLDLPKRSLKPAKTNALLDLKSNVRQILQAAGANELLTYSFVHGNLLDKTGQNKELAFQLSNALSPDLQYYRLSILPSMLDKVHPNIKAGYDQFAIYEIGKIHIKDHLDADKLPKEDEHLAFVFAADAKVATSYAGAPYFQAREYLDNLLASLGVEYTLLPISNDADSLTHALAPFVRSRAAFIAEKSSQEVFGAIGEFNDFTKQNLKLPDFIAGFEIEIYKILEFADKKGRYSSLSKYPKVQQDISLKIPNNVTFGQIFGFVSEEVDKTKPDNAYFELKPLDIYQRDDDQDHKQVAFRLTIASYQKTLKAEEVNGLLDSVASAASQKFGAQRL